MTARSRLAARRTTGGRILNRADAWWTARDFDVANNRYTDMSGGGRHFLLPGGGFDPLLLTYDTVRGQCCYLPGGGVNYLSTPDSVPLSITGDITLETWVAMNDWSPAAGQQILLSKWTVVGNQRSYGLQINSSGTLTFNASSDGSVTAGPFGAGISNANLSALANGAYKGLRVSVQASTRRCRFYTSDDGVTWTQLGTNVTASGTWTSLFDGTAVFEIGSQATGTAFPMMGRVYQVKIYNSDIGSGSGTPVFDWNAADHVSPFTAGVAERSANAAIVTPVRNPANRKLEFVDRTMVIFDRTLDTYLYVPDDPLFDLNVTDSMTIVVAMRHYITAQAMVFIAKRNGSATADVGWVHYCGATGAVGYIQSDGVIAPATTIAPAPVAGAEHLSVSQRDVPNDILRSYMNGTTTTTRTDTTTATLENASRLCIGRYDSGLNNLDMAWFGAAFFKNQVLSVAEQNKLATELLVAAA